MAEARRAERVRASDGLSLSVREWGNPDGPEILLVHGIAQSHLCFERQVDSPLARDHRIVALDLRGHGDSDKPEDISRYTDPLRWGEDIDAVIGAMGLKRPTLIGWSLGGRVVAHYLMLKGDQRISGICFVGSRMSAEADLNGPAATAWREARRDDLAGHIRAAAAFLHGCYEIQPDAETFAFQLGYNLAAAQAVQDAIRTTPIASERIFAAFGKVSVPALIIHGAKDRVTLPLSAERIVAALPTARRILYEDCGHSPFFEAADRFNRDLADLVQTATTGR